MLSVHQERIATAIVVVVSVEADARIASQGLRTTDFSTVAEYLLELYYI